MGISYQAVQWNRQKLIYDLILLVTVGLYLWLFVAVCQNIGATDNTTLDLRGIRIRAYGSAAFILLHIILSIGPLSRLNQRFLPLLYNRRHMGVTMFCLALFHAEKALTWYHDFGNLEPMVSLLVSNTHYADFIRFPFESLGIIALIILFLMAATSHDFWLTNLTAPVWKALHMGVYIAYGLLVGHVILGALETNRNPLLTLVVAIGFVWIVSIHLVASCHEQNRDHLSLIAQASEPDNADFIEVGHIHEIPENRAKIVVIAGERVAIFKYDGKLSAVSNVCQHQNGPLGEGKIVEGCITCPWHGYQYLPKTGESPPPFTEKIPTFDLRLEGDRIWVRTRPNLPGTPVEPALIPPEVVS